MGSGLKECQCLVGLSPAQRCTDFDSECADVPNVYWCWSGGDSLPVADGYCPLWAKQALENNSE